MKLLCLALLVLAGHQALANPRRVIQQPVILNPVPVENLKVNLGMTTGKPEATTGNLEVTTRKPWVIEPRHERIAPRAYPYTAQNKPNRCKEGEFQCDTDFCISEVKRCDGRVNCADGTDEDECYQEEKVVNTVIRESRQGCGSVFSHSSGTIVYPIGGGNYQNDADCVWVINAGTPIQITFTSFQVENRYDFLQIRDGESSGSSELGKLTGHNLPEPVETSGNAAYLQFTSDHSVTFSGFELHWAPSGCPEARGYTRLPGSQRCFKLYMDVDRDWYASMSKCRDDGAIMVKTSDAEAVIIRKGLIDKYGGATGNYAWLDAKYNGAQYVWNDGKWIANDNALWWPGQPQLKIDYCLLLLNNEHHMNAHPSKPYWPDPCTKIDDGRKAFCELLM